MQREISCYLMKVNCRNPSFFFLSTQNKAQIFLSSARRSPSAAGEYHQLSSYACKGQSSEAPPQWGKRHKETGKQTPPVQRQPRARNVKALTYCAKSQSSFTAVPQKYLCDPLRKMEKSATSQEVTDTILKYFKTCIYYMLNILYVTYIYVT